jgi:hypothetical protein
MKINAIKKAPVIARSFSVIDLGIYYSLTRSQ